MVDPRTKLLGELDVTGARGLEIGPLHSPRVSKDEGDVRYLDHATADELRAKYANDGLAAPLAHLIVDVDYIWRPGQTLAEAVQGETFDYVVASHLIEHIPDLIGWLMQIHSILAPDGVIALVIPDKRYCFDVNRQLTTMADLVDSHLRRLEIPSLRQIYDHESNFVPVDAGDLWAGADQSGERRRDVDDPDRFALACCKEQLASPDKYRDVHCHTFTPDSFLSLVERMIVLDMFDYTIRFFFPTEFGHHEFFVTLQRAEPATSSEAKLESVHRHRDSRVEQAVVASEAPNGRVVMDVSSLEARALGWKRAAMARIRVAHEDIRTRRRTSAK